jgi:hypothetical protein
MCVLAIKDINGWFVSVRLTEECARQRKRNPLCWKIVDHANVIRWYDAAAVARESSATVEVLREGNLSTFVFTAMGQITKSSQLELALCGDWTEFVADLEANPPPEMVGLVIQPEGPHGQFKLPNGSQMDPDVALWSFSEVCFDSVWCFLFCSYSFLLRLSISN